MPTVRANGIELTYEERGSGAPLVLVSGIGMQLCGWPDGFLDGLAAHGLRIIVFDNRDVGLSTKLDAAGGLSVNTVKSHVKNLYRKLDVSSRATLVRAALDEES